MTLIAAPCSQTKTTFGFGLGCWLLCPHTSTAFSRTIVRRNRRETFMGSYATGRIRVLSEGSRVSPSFRAGLEVVEKRHTVGLSPHSDFPGVCKSAVIPIQRLLAVEGHGEMSTVKVDAQRVPLTRRDLHTCSLPFRAASIDRVIDRDVVFQGV